MYCGRTGCKREIERQGEEKRKSTIEEGEGSVMTDSGGNGIRSRVRFGVRENEGVASRTCLRARKISVTLVNAPPV